MSHFGDFMDGVPVKISEKYKRPPKIELPYSVHEYPLRAQNVVEIADYSTTFETNVLAKIKELRSAKETKKNERRHRLQLLEEAKQKKLDEIAAAEAEERLKQLSVSEVSYPSTDEISALSPDEKPDRTCDTTPTADNSPEPAEALAPAINAEPTYPTCSTSDTPNILQPILVPAAYNQNNLLDDPDPLQELKMNTKITKMPHYSNVETLTYKDFENDTSSPFDNVELKTINDMELLAQVLQSQRESATSCHPQQPYTDPNAYTMPNCASQAQLEGMTYMPPAYMEPSIHGPSGVIYSPQHYPISNGYYVPTEPVCDNPMQVENVNNMYMPNYPYYVPANSYNVVDPNYYPSPMPTEVSQPANGYIPEPYYFHYPHVSMQYPPAGFPTPSNENQIVQNQNQTVVNKTSVSNAPNTVKSRSRSVPDIVRELNEELALAKRRANERSYNASPAPKSIPQPSSSQTKEEKRNKKKPEVLKNPFDKLPASLQQMCQKIHGMGFPLDRVARVSTLIGDNDKKIIEALLILGELMDLGFSEKKALLALSHHEFNRDKALDDLVS